MQMEDIAPETEGRPQQSEAEEAAEFAAFQARVEQRGGVVEPEPDDEWGDDDGGEESAVDDTPEGQADEASAEGEGEPDAEAVQASLDDSLKAALKLDGFSEEQIARELAADPDGLVKQAQRRAKSQRDVNQAFQELAQLKKQLGSSPESGKEAGEPAQPAVANSDEMTKQLAEELGEETAGAVVKLIEAREAKLRAELQELKNSQAARQQAATQAAVSAARQTLVERFPEVADDETWTRIYETAALVEKRFENIADDRERIGAVLEYAARAELGTGESSADANPRRSGKSPTPPRRKSPSKPVSTEQREYDRWQAKRRARSSA